MRTECCMALLVAFFLLFKAPLISSSNEVYHRAYITVEITGSNNGVTNHANIPSFVTEGIFSNFGPLKNAQGLLCKVDKNFLLKPNLSSKDENWIGIIYDEDINKELELDDIENERDNRGNRIKASINFESKIQMIKKSLKEKMREILLLGASALIIMAKNVHFTKEFDVTEVFTKPVIFLHGVENVTKILQLFSLRYNLFAKIQQNIPYYSVANTIGTVTLWATCGRSTSGAYHEWQGVVCIGRRAIPGKAMDEYFNIMTWNAALILFICFIVYFYLKLSRNGFEFEERSIEINNETLAKHILSQMSIEIYRAKGRTSGKKHRKRAISVTERDTTFDNHTEQCVICLDMFFPLQRLRVLPCKHSFHLNCIDRWLLLRQTCPMCKYNILDNTSTTHES